MMEGFLLNVSFGALLALLFGCWWGLAFQPAPLEGRFGWFLRGLLGAASLGLTGVLGLRWWTTGHFPLSNLYESLLFLAWSLTALQVRAIRSLEGPWLLAILSPISLLVTAFATFSLPAEMQEGSPLVPALRSNWLMMHVTVMMCSYASLLAGSLMAVTFLVVTKGQSIDLKEIILRIDEVPESSSWGAGELSDVFDPTIVPESSSWGTDELPEPEPRLPLARQLDNLSYRTIGIGFPLLTIGIISGAVWANEAWGSYWSWDPKETWALITWVVYAIYLHTRITWGWQGKGPAMVASLGFIVVWICYLGVNLLGQGLHSYGWLLGS
jgi:cytochrome c-type biogenesis protein CcsB